MPTITNVEETYNKFEGTAIWANGNNEPKLINKWSNCSCVIVTGLTI
jgi:hypothetical protein